MNNPKSLAPHIYIIEEPAVEAPSPGPAAGSGNRRQKILIRIGVLLPLVLLAFTLARGANENKYFPDHLLGVWQSSDGSYADCYMEITPATVLFGNAEKGYLLYFVSSVEESPAPTHTTYVVHYTDLDGIKYQMSLVYSPTPQETIYFSHQAKVAWTRRPSD
jgi:hypothetical protein